MKYVYFVGYTEEDKDGPKYNINKECLLTLEVKVTDIKPIKEKLMKSKSSSDIINISLKSINFLHNIEEASDENKVYI